MLLFKYNIPNSLSILRIILTFTFPTFLYQELPAYALLIFIIAAFTDFLDGYLARRWNAQSSFGSKIDPLADKILMISSYLSLYFIKLIPLYVVGVVILRDLLILFCVFICMINKIAIKIDPIFSSKINTAIQISYVLILLACKCFLINVPLFVDICSFVVCLSTIFSAIEYGKKYYWIKDEIWKPK